MKTHIKNPLLVPGLIAVLGSLAAGQVTAQTFTTLHSFTWSDGVNPVTVTLSGNTLYGTASQGGGSGVGTVFAVNTDGTGFTTLHSFTPIPAYPEPYTNSDGAYIGRAISSGDTLFGVALYGGSGGAGTVFAVNTNGTGFTTLYSFTALSEVFSGTNSDGALPDAGLVLSGSTLYGTATHGGSSGVGTVFALNTNGTDFTTLHHFTAAYGPVSYAPTNSDGAFPTGMILSSNTLYGTAEYGGVFGGGTVFAVNTDGTGFRTLYNFTATSHPGYTDGTNSDGANPQGGLILSGNTLYGAAYLGGSSGNGTVFALHTDGTGFTNLHIFAASDYYGRNSDGALPGDLTLSGNTLYGTALQGGSSGNGALFAVRTDGTGFTNLHSFTATPPYPGPYTNSDGTRPVGRLILSGNTLYGTAQLGGSSHEGTVFSISFRPQLAITPSGTNVVLSWPVNVNGFDYTGFTMQSTTNPASPAAWSTNSPAPVIIAGQNVVTNPIIGPQQFYRLSQ